MEHGYVPSGQVRGSSPIPYLHECRPRAWQIL